jgi:putative drug exporter of the RND superfamily
MNVDVLFAALGRFGVRFRWPMLVAWVTGAVAATALLPSLSSVTQNDNTKFLPASAPVEHAIKLAAPFGVNSQMGTTVIAARTGARLTPADFTALTALRHSVRRLATVTKVTDLSVSSDGQAAQFAVLSLPPGPNQSAATDLVNAMRAKVSSAARAGLAVHLTGPLPIDVDQQKANGSQGNKLQLLTALLIVVLLVLIFRSLTLALVTLIPAIISFAIAGPLVAEAAQHGLKVSPIAQFLMIVLVLGAGTDYGLFLVFRVREQLHVAGHRGGPADRSGGTGLGRALAGDLRRPRPAERQAIVTAITRVGESITFSAATVIVAVLTLTLATFSFYADLGVPFAIAIGVTLLAALTLLPALLSIRLSLLGVKRTLFQAWFGRPKLLPWNIQGSGRAGTWGRLAERIVRHPAPTLLAGVIFFGGLAVGAAGYAAGGFGGNTAPPAGSDSAAGATLLSRHFPQSSLNPTVLLFKLPSPAWSDPAPLAAAQAKISSSHQFTHVAGPLNPVGFALTPRQYAQLHSLLGAAQKLPPIQPSTIKIPAAAYQIYRATAHFISPDGRTVQYLVGLRAGDPGQTVAMNAIPGIRTQTTQIAHAIGATDSGVSGEAPALYDISHVSSDDLKKIIPIAILAIGLLLALVLRSLVAPLYLIASVGVSYLAALGLSVLLFIDAGGESGLVFFLPFLMFIFLLALGEDYNILMMTRIREEAHKLPLRQAVSRALTATGTTITSAGLVLAGSFVVLAFVAGSSSTQIRDIGFALALGILMDTFLVRTLLVPSTVVLLGRLNWWPSRLTADEPDVPAVEPGAVTERTDQLR